LTSYPTFPALLPFQTILSPSSGCQSFSSLGTTILDNDINVHTPIKQMALYGKENEQTQPKIIFNHVYHCAIWRSDTTDTNLGILVTLQKPCEVKTIDHQYKYYVNVAPLYPT